MAGPTCRQMPFAFSGFSPFEQAARWREAEQAAQTFRTFDELLTSPDGAATLAKLGKTSPMSPTFGALPEGFETGAQQGIQGNAELRKQLQPYNPRHYAAITPQVI